MSVQLSLFFLVCYPLHMQWKRSSCLSPFSLKYIKYLETLTSPSFTTIVFLLKTEFSLSTTLFTEDFPKGALKPKVF
jgi:hypothetical protein